MTDTRGLTEVLEDAGYLAVAARLRMGATPLQELSHLRDRRDYAVGMDLYTPAIEIIEGWLTERKSQ